MDTQAIQRLSIVEDEVLLKLVASVDALPPFGPRMFSGRGRNIREISTGIIAVRSQVDGLTIFFGCFSKDRYKCAQRYADMVVNEVWKYRKRRGLPPLDNELNFGSSAFAFKDWVDYSDTYGATLKKIFSRLVELKVIQRNPKGMRQLCQDQNQ